MKGRRFVLLILSMLLTWHAVCVNALEGELKTISDPCEAMSHHGFLGLDSEVVDAIASWIKTAQGSK